MRYILALEAQKRAQILVISNAQRKLVSSFQQKLQSSAAMSERHMKWVRDAKSAQERLKMAGEKGELSSRKFKKTRTLRKARPKTTGLNKEDRLILKNGTCSSFANFTQCNKASNHNLQPREAMVECVEGKHLQNERNDTHDGHSRSAKGNISACNLESFKCASQQLRHKSWHTGENLSRDCVAYNDDKAKRSSVEGDLSVFGTGSLELKKNQKMITESDFCIQEIAQRLNHGEHLSQIINDEKKEIEVCGKILTSRKQNLGKSNRVDVNRVTENELFSTEKRDTLEIRDKAFGNIDSLRIDNYKVANDFGKAKSIVKARSANEHASVNSTRSARKSGHTHSYRSKSGYAQSLPERKMPYELRTWISSIKRDVDKVQSCTEDASFEPKPMGIAHKDSWKSENSSLSSIALERFNEIFQDLYVNEAVLDEDSECDRGKESVDASSLYGKAAVIDSRLDESQNWHRRDPRNKKLKPSILL